MGTTLDWSWNLSSLRCSTHGNSCNFSISTAPPMASLTSLTPKSMQTKPITMQKPSQMCLLCIVKSHSVSYMPLTNTLWIGVQIQFPGCFFNYQSCNMRWFFSLFVLTTLHGGYVLSALFSHLAKAAYCSRSSFSGRMDCLASLTRRCNETSSIIFHGFSAGRSGWVSSFCLSSFFFLYRDGKWKRNLSQSVKHWEE